MRQNLSYLNNIIFLKKKKATTTSFCIAENSPFIQKNVFNYSHNSTRFETNRHLQMVSKAILSIMLMNL